MCRTFAKNTIKHIIKINEVSKSINSISSFLNVIESCLPAKNWNKYLAKVFQAIRIEVNKELESFEQIKRYTILTERFTEQNGMLTPTQKIKQKMIIETYSDQIEKMYDR